MRERMGETVRGSSGADSDSNQVGVVDQRGDHTTATRASRPARSILSPSFKYVNAANTNIARTFARVRREQREIEQAKAEQAAREASASTVRSIKRKATA